MSMARLRKTHPYKNFEGSVIWRAVEKAILALARNGDIKELTAREYIVGSICSAIASGRHSD
jgi:hypothetical protein